ncbi:GAT domain-containing protein [Biscogniauxia marginata]|nr:GAT domain-containing protein [Biscogniauxia marginata]
MKSLRMSKMLGSMKMGRRGGSSASTTSGDPNEDGPEATAGRNVKSFCESGGASNAGDEVLHLPPIVDAAEDSPAAAAECARIIRKYLKRDYATKPQYQNNAIMLIRILADNPGPTFTRNFDQKFTDTVKELLRTTRDSGVRQLLMDTLDYFETAKAYDEGLALIIAMWKKEKEKSQGKYSQRQGSQPPAPRTLNAPPFNPHSQNYFSRSHNSRKLPDAVELASRLEEARTSANLLQQVVTNTPPGEVLDNDLIKEFADRCLSASRSIQLYMRAEDPAPDNETMESLIDTNEHLQTSLNLHQRAMLNARKHVAAVGGQDDNDLMGPIDDRASNGYSVSRQPSPSSLSDQPPLPPRKPNGKGKGREYEPAVAGSSRTHTPDDPFRDPAPEPSGSGSGTYNTGIGRSASGAGRGSSSQYQDQEPRLAYEPFHPGFDPTPSYLGRQESALGKETMHGGAADAHPASDSRDAVRDNDSDIYDTHDVPPPPPKQKEAVYRY